MIILDGKKLFQQILAEVKEGVRQIKKDLRLAVVVVGKDPVVEKFIAQKRKAAEFVGVDFKIYPYDADIPGNELRSRIGKICRDRKTTGMVVQLSLPAHISSQQILNAVLPQKDVDVLSARGIGDMIVGKSPLLPPVAGSVKAFFDAYEIPYAEKKIVIMGSGDLVGKPVSLWLLKEHVSFSLLAGAAAPDSAAIIAEADILITGIRKRKFIIGEMVKEGVIVIDAGTSESEGKLAGDVDFDSVSSKASFMTPVPGGVGPVTVALLFKNLLELASRSRT